jgi:hypothetical protein
MLAASLMRLLPAASVLCLVACGSDTSGPSSSISSGVSCEGVAPVQLAGGAHAVIDPTTTGGCLRLPAASGTGAEYLVVALSANGQVTDEGATASYQLSTGASGGAMAATAAVPQANPPAGLSPAQRFHNMLRARGRTLSHAAFNASVSRAPSVAASTVAVGSERNFKVCGDLDCASFVTVSATVKHVGPHGLIYLDNAAPANGYTQADLDRVGSLFDEFLYPIDTTAFGRETDLDGNNAVAVLLSPAVNQISGKCNTTQSVILGFFFPNDLIPGSAGSNSGEVFYGIVPDPTNSDCTISRAFALQNIGATFLHEFQHMISFGRHAVLNTGSAEDHWLDEALSRLAEELGGREVPDSFCSPPSCLTQYPSGDVENAFQYLRKDTLDAVPLIEPGNAADGTLSEDGANWLFIRWLADHFATDSILGTSLTRKLDGADSPNGTGLTGSINVSSVIGIDFPTLVGEWQMANYLTAVSGFTESTGRLRYRSWDLRSTFTKRFGSYPLQPDSVGTTSYSHAGVLHQGSGRHLRVIQGATGSAVDLTFTDTNGGVVSSSMVPRFGVTRVR